MTEDINETLVHYKKNVGFLIRDFNKKFPLPYYFAYMLGKRGEYNVADLGAGPVCRLGGVQAGIRVNIHASDVLQPEYKKLMDDWKTELLIPIEYQDMENLTYPDGFFDVVHCVNALDHTKDARKAIEEMKRVCKKGGWIYMRHSPNQMKYCKGEHFWNATKDGFSNNKESIALDGFATHIDGYFIISTMQKI